MEDIISNLQFLSQKAMKMVRSKKTYKLYLEQKKKVKMIPILRKESKENWYGIPKHEIEWCPEIDYKKCIGCRLCVLECATHVFRFDFKRHVAEVIKSLKCKIGCTTCINLCLAKAIKLPPLPELYKLMKKGNIIDLCWEKLDYNKYMWI